MRRLFSAFCLLLGILAPLSAATEEKKNYIALKPGIFTFTGGMRERGFATGFDGTVVVGRHLHRNIAVEAGWGYFHDGVNKFYGNNVRGTQVLLSLKGIYPIGSAEVFAGGGGGVYPTQFHGKIGETVIDARDTVLGGHLLAGIQFPLSRVFFTGFEGKYLMTGKAGLKITDANLTGYGITAVIGARF